MLCLKSSLTKLRLVNTGGYSSITPIDFSKPVINRINFLSGVTFIYFNADTSSSRKKRKSGSEKFKISN